MKKLLGIFGLLLAVTLLTTLFSPQFVQAFNLQNIGRLVALYAILGIGVAFVIITGGIDLSIGSVVGLVGSLLPLLLVHYHWPVAAALLFVLAISAALGALHGLLITRLKLQPFIVTLCGLLIYRGVSRWITGDQVQGFGGDYPGLRFLAIGKPFELPIPFLRWISEGNWSRFQWNYRADDFLLDETGNRIAVDFLEWVPVQMPFLIMIGLAILAGVFLNRMVWGRYLIALGRNEEAARYSGINTGRMVVLAYVICSLLAGIGGVLFALDSNTIQPSGQGSYHELYAIAAAVLGGCSLRGGEGSILGVILGAAVLRVLTNAIGLLGVPSQLEHSVVGCVILLGVITDEVVKRYLARRRALAEAR